MIKKLSLALQAIRNNELREALDFDANNEDSAVEYLTTHFSEEALQHFLDENRVEPLFSFCADLDGHLVVVITEETNKPLSDDEKGHILDRIEDGTEWGDLREEQAAPIRLWETTVHI